MFLFLLQMPPRCSRGSKRPSTQALEVSASKPAKRARKSGTGANPSSESDGGGAISEDLISAIVTSVTAEVTRQLNPTSSGQNPVQPADGSPLISAQGNIEVPVVQALAGLHTAGTALHAPTSNTYSSTSATSQLANVASFLLRSSLQP